jgi:hypothetical protein
MGRFLKNTQLTGGSYSVQLPLGSNTVGPDSPQPGQIRFNQDTSKIEFYYNAGWNQVAKIGNTAIAIDQFTGNSVQTEFVMTQSESFANAVVVTIGGVYQIPTTHYTVLGTTIAFTSAPPAPGVNPNQIVVIHNLNSTKTIGD